MTEKFKPKWCVKYTTKNPSPTGWKYLDGTPAMDYKREDEWYGKESDAMKRVQFLMTRDDVIKLTLTKKIIFKD